jgi:hypothetical protein
MNSRRLDSKLSWTLGVLLVLLAVCFASATQAEPRMYTGSLIIHAFGNDTTTGTAPPFQTGEAVGIPLTGNCNTEPYHAKETLTFPTTPTGTDTVMFTVPAYGGATLMCNGTVPCVGTNCGTIVCGCGDASQELGDPLSGFGVISTTGMASTNRTSLDPRKFTIAQSELNKVKQGEASFERYGVYLWEVHFADLHNEAAAFSKSGGDGNFGPIIHNAAKQKRSVVQTAGKNQFGGTMKLLGSYGDNEGYFYAGGGVTSVFYYNWLFNYLGDGGQVTKAGVVTGGKVVGPIPAFGYTRASGMATTSFAEIEVFKWTTGTVAVTAVGGTFPTIQQRKGYDNRTAMGSGVVQLVSPMLSKWTGAGVSSTAGIGIMKISFTPEPSEWMMLAGGVSMLGLLFHKHRSRRSS